LARRLGVSRPTLYNWDRVPAERVPDLVVAVDGAMTSHDVRPDLYPPSDQVEKEQAA
jgi:DNA-binding transcriptional regulator YdaS (Cro superfamily)